MHPFYERVLVLKNLCKGFYIRPKLQPKRRYQSRVMFLQLKKLSLYPGFTKKKPRAYTIPPSKLLDITTTLKRGWMSVGCAHSGSLPFLVCGGKVRGQGTVCLLQLILRAWERLLLVVRCSAMIHFSRTVQYLFDL